MLFSGCAPSFIYKILVDVFLPNRFVFLLLTHLDLELRNPDAKLPPINPNRYGFGMLQPDGDLQVRYRLKRTQTMKS